MGELRWYQQDKAHVEAELRAGRRPDLATTTAVGPLDELVALHDEVGAFAAVAGLGSTRKREGIDDVLLVRTLAVLPFVGQTGFRSLADQLFREPAVLLQLGWSPVQIRAGDNGRHRHADGRQAESLPCHPDTLRDALARIEASAWLAAQQRAVQGLYRRGLVRGGVYAVDGTGLSASRRTACSMRTCKGWPAASAWPGGSTATCGRSAGTRSRGPWRWRGWATSTAGRVSWGPRPRSRWRKPGRWSAPASGRSRGRPSRRTAAAGASRTTPSANSRKAGGSSASRGGPKRRRFAARWRSPSWPSTRRNSIAPRRGSAWPTRGSGDCGNCIGGSWARPRSSSTSTGATGSSPWRRSWPRWAHRPGRASAPPPVSPERRRRARHEPLSPHIWNGARRLASRPRCGYDGGRDSGTVSCHAAATPAQLPTDTRRVPEAPGNEDRRVSPERKVYETMVSEAADQAIGMPLVVAGPWTREAREQAIRRETRDAL